MSSIIATLSLNNQYTSLSLCTSVLMDGQLHSAYSYSLPKCSSSIVANLISSAVIQSGMSIYYSVAFMVMLLHSISSSLFAWLLCLDGQSVTNSCDQSLYNILMLYWWIHSSSLCSLVISLLHLFKIATSGLWPVIILSL